MLLWAMSRHVTVKAKTTIEHNKVVSKPSFKKKNQRVFSKVCISYIMIFPFRSRENFKCHVEKFVDVVFCLVYLC